MWHLALFHTLVSDFSFIRRLSFSLILLAHLSGTIHSFPFFFYPVQRVPGHLFFSDNDIAKSWLDKPRCFTHLRSYTISYLSYPLICSLWLEAYCLIKILQHAQYPLRDLCSLVLIASSLIFAATNTTC